MLAHQPPFRVYLSALYGQQVQAVPAPAATARGAGQATRLACELVDLHGGVAVVLGPGTYRDSVTGPTLLGPGPGILPR